MDKKEWDLAVCRADLADRDRWLQEIAFALNSDPDKRGGEIMDSIGIIQRIFVALDAQAARIAALEDALRPFAGSAKWWNGSDQAEHTLLVGTITLQDIRRAATVLRRPD